MKNKKLLFVSLMFIYLINLQALYSSGADAKWMSVVAGVAAAEETRVVEGMSVVAEEMRVVEGTLANEKTEYSFEGDLGHSENTPLYFGNPSDAIFELDSSSNYLMEKAQFILSYNAQTLCPNWVGWHLSASDLGEADRTNKFAADKDLPDEWYAVTKADYKFNAYGFDRGHICPSADRTLSAYDNAVTFVMTNMVPQAPDCNRIVWMHLENYERELAKQGNELYIFAGPYGSGGTGAKGFFENIPVMSSDGVEYYINVPAYTWKILLILPEGEDDMTRLDKAQVICVNIPNEQECNKKGNWEFYKCPVNEIESLTGYDFFELIPDELEELLEK